MAEGRRFVGRARPFVADGQLITKRDPNQHDGQRYDELPRGIRRIRFPLLLIHDVMVAQGRSVVTVT